MATYATSIQNFTASWTTLGCSQAAIQVWTPIEENGGHGKASSSVSQWYFAGADPKVIISHTFSIIFFRSDSNLALIVLLIDLLTSWMTIIKVWMAHSKGEHECTCGWPGSVPTGLQTFKIETQIHVSNKVQVTWIRRSSTHENTSTCYLVKKSTTSRIWTNSLLYLSLVMP